MAGLSSVSKMETNCVLNIFKGFLIRFALRVTTLQGGTIHKVAVFVFLENDFKQAFFHKYKYTIFPVGRQVWLQNGVVTLEFVVGYLGAVGVPLDLFILDELREDVVTEGAADELA